MTAGRTNHEKICDVIAVLAMVMMIGMIVANWQAMPPEVPRHFGITGKPDRWGSKTSLLFLPIAALILHTLLTFAGRNQSMINLPASVDRNSPAVREILRGMMATLKAAVLLTFLYIEIASVLTALGRAEGLGSQFLPVAVGLPLILLLYYLNKLKRAG